MKEQSFSNVGEEYWGFKGRVDVRPYLGKIEPPEQNDPAFISKCNENLKKHPKYEEWMKFEVIDFSAQPPISLHYNTNIPSDSNLSSSEASQAYKGAFEYTVCDQYYPKEFDATQLLKSIYEDCGIHTNSVLKDSMKDLARVIHISISNSGHINKQKDCELGRLAVLLSSLSEMTPIE